MSTVIAGQTLPLLSQWYAYEGGPLTDLDTTPSLTITNIATGVVVRPTSPAGVTHPGTGSYGVAWTPAADAPAGEYLAVWSGWSDAAPVVAVEPVTVVGLSSSADANTSPAGVWYATREDVKGAVDYKETARNNRKIDRALEGASRSVEERCHRHFYPVAATRFWDWPNGQRARPWRLWLDASELISITTMSSGGTPIAEADWLLEPNQYGPPYNRVELNIGSSAAFGGGSTLQRDITITGLYGYRNDETTIGTTGAAVDSSEPTVTVDGDASAALGVGSILRVDAERLIVTGRRQADTGQTLGADLAVQNNATSVQVADGGTFAIDEAILIDSEAMLVVDIAGNSLTVKRGWDGSTLAAHTAGATIYAPRRLVVRRAALGTTAAAHSSATIVHRWDPPGPVRQLTIAEALVASGLEHAAYSQVLRSGEGDTERRRDMSGIKGLRAEVYDSHGRKARLRGV